MSHPALLRAEALAVSLDELHELLIYLLSGAGHLHHDPGLRQVELMAAGEAARSEFDEPARGCRWRGSLRPFRIATREGEIQIGAAARHKVLASECSRVPSCKPQRNGVGDTW